MERRTELYVGTLRKFIEAMNGELVIAARFADGVERESGGHAGGHRTNEEVVGIRRPLLASIFGCGGALPSWATRVMVVAA
jgi:hypothetical protein